ncbi:MAG: tRNA pseudouridine(55) synthase TruB [Treponema sp.]|nr:tRNA pseudouridine(55) synthase TruB [Treponema sp.]
MDGIVLLAKKRGLTSFASLSNIKKALKTSKVGHTGTLDSFAQGLLVVCCGRLTRLAGNITEFDKTYSAVIKFGAETDTLEYTGTIIKEAPLPEKKDLIAAIEHFKGPQMQKPPAFSAIHVDGKRSSDLARKGQISDIPARNITVYSAELEEIKLNSQGKVLACLVKFTVSKGTYIRSLARDIGNYCNSAAYLVGLYRSRVGEFKIEDAAGVSELEDFTIDNCLADERNYQADEKVYYSENIQEEILQKIQTFTRELSIYCGFVNINLKDSSALAEFSNGKALKNRLFTEDLYKIPNKSIVAVFFEESFCGLLEKDENGKIKYKFVKK